METLCERNYIREERERAGVTLTALSEQSGIPMSTLSRYQNGAEVPMSALQKIADVLNIPVSALLSRRQLPEDDKLTYDQLCLQLQSAQQRIVLDTMRYSSLKRAYRWSLVLVVVLAIFVIYAMIDRFVFPDGGIFRAAVRVHMSVI